MMCLTTIEQGNNRDDDDDGGTSSVVDWGVVFPIHRASDNG